MPVEQASHKIKIRFALFANKYIYFKEKYLRRNWQYKTEILENKIENVGIVIVNYNTRDLLTILLFSIFKNLSIDRISKIIIVDNNSQDGSKILLKNLNNNPLIKVVNNRNQQYHGPALNQGIALLNKIRKREKPFRFIWILDSDVIILKKNILKDAIDFMINKNAAVIGQFQYDHSNLGDPHVSSILIDPEKVWNRQIHPFTNNGMPTVLFYKDIRKHEMKIYDFPFRSNNYILHIGRGTLMQIFKNQEKINQHFQWSNTHNDYHFHGTKKGGEIMQQIQKLASSKIGEFTTSNICNIISNDKSYSIEFEKILKAFNIY